jgi:phage shock protein C
MTRRLYRSSRDRMVAGVCGGLGEYLDVDPTLIRLLFVAAVLAGFGSGILLYLVLMIVMPLEESMTGQEAADGQSDQDALVPAPEEAELEEGTELEEGAGEVGATHL